MSCGKLVRDKIPDIIRSNGEIPVCRTLDHNEIKKFLFIKLMEEYQEVQQAYFEYQQNTIDKDSMVKNVIEELADLLEVIVSLGALEGIEEEEIIYLSRGEEYVGPKDKLDCWATLSKTIRYIVRYRIIHQTNYINLVGSIRYLATSIGLKEHDVLMTMAKKREERGGFTKGIYLDNVIKKEYTK